MARGIGDGLESDMNSTIKTMITATLLALAALAGTAFAQLAPNTVIEAAVETTTDNVIFPSSTAGRIQVRGCEGCLHSTLQLDANTRFNLGGHNVSLREMAAYASATSHRPLDIHYRLRDSVVSLVSVLTK
jgi:hypothetical protein